MNSISHKALILSLVFILPLICTSIPQLLPLDNDQYSLFLIDNEASENESEQKEEKDNAAEEFAFLHQMGSIRGSQYRVIFFAGNNSLPAGCSDTLIDPPEPICSI